MSAFEFDDIAVTHVGCQRSLNEDAVMNDAARRLWAIADGMGGHEAGEVASAMVIEALSRCPLDAEGHALAPDAIAALKDVNMRLVDLARTQFDNRTIGSTVVGLVANNDRFNCFWAGDSRAYRIRDGAIERLTRDHSLVQELVDAGMLEENKAEHHPNANIITRAVGVSDQLEVEIVEGEIRADDLFLLASDGLTRLVSEEEILAELGNGDLAGGAQRLLTMTLDRDAPDNVSLVIVRAR